MLGMLETTLEDFLAGQRNKWGNETLVQDDCYYQVQKADMLMYGVGSVDKSKNSVVAKTAIKPQEDKVDAAPYILVQQSAAFCLEQLYEAVKWTQIGQKTNNNETSELPFNSRTDQRTVWKTP